MKRMEQPKLAKLVKDFYHPPVCGKEVKIGGKDIIVEREGTIAYILDLSFDSPEWTIAVANFVKRRPELLANENENMKLYYGHVEGLGYFVAEDEIDGDMTDFDESMYNML